MPPRADKITRKQRETWARDRDRERLKVLRNALKGARGTRRDRVAAVRAACKAERERLRAQALEQQRALRESIQRMRVEARKLCGQNLETAQRDAGAAIMAAIAALTDEQTRQFQAKLWERPAFCPTRKPSRKGEARAESDCEVAQNITDPLLLPVWEKVKHRIKGNARKTRTEAFLEWVEEHAAEVAEIQTAAIESSVAALVREEEATRKRLGKGYGSMSDRELERVASSSTPEAVPVESEPRAGAAWLAWSASGAGALRQWRYRADRAGAADSGLPPWRDFGHVDARNGDDAIALVVQHLAEHHIGDKPFPAWVELEDWTTRHGGKLSYYVRGPGDVTRPEPTDPDQARELERDAERLRREDAEMAAELAAQKPKRKRSESAPATRSDEGVGLPHFVAIMPAVGASDWSRGQLRATSHREAAQRGLSSFPHITYPARVNVEVLTPDLRNTGDVESFWAPRAGELLRIGAEISDSEAVEAEQAAARKATRRKASDKGKATKAIKQAEREATERRRKDSDRRELLELERRIGLRASDVLRAARARDVERFHDDRAFIASVFDHMAERGTYRGTLDQFKAALWELYTSPERPIALSRAELVGVMDPAMVDRSELYKHGATFHFIATDGGGAPAVPF